MDEASTKLAELARARAAAPSAHSVRSWLSRVALGAVSRETMFRSRRSDPFRRFKEGLYRLMSKDDIKADMNARYDTGNAYPTEARWAHFHHQDLEQTMAEMLKGETEDRVILELGSGTGGVAPHNIHDASRIVATDLSDSALRVARDFFKDRSEISFRQMDSEMITFPDRTFDIVIAKEVIEHLQRPQECLREVRRVLKDGGLFILSSPNRDSLHLRVNRKLGRDDFVCSGDHLQEFTYSEMTALLVEHGFGIEASEGVTLMPYHCVEGVFPPALAEAEDRDEEFIEWLRVLGRRAGPEFAFCYIILART